LEGTSEGHLVQITPYRNELLNFCRRKRENLHQKHVPWEELKKSCEQRHGGASESKINLGSEKVTTLSMKCSVLVLKRHVARVAYIYAITTSNSCSLQ